MIGKRVYYRGKFGTICDDRNSGMYDIELDPASTDYDPEIPKSLGRPVGKTIRCVCRDEFELVEVKTELGKALFDLGRRVGGL